jgi:GAF domain-containing protein
LKLALTVFSAELLAAQEVIPRARIIARVVTEALRGSSVNVYTPADGDAVWVPRASSGEHSIRGASVSSGARIFAELKTRRESLLLAGNQLSREDYAHLDVRRTLRSLAYLPLETKGALVGIMEILSFEAELARLDIDDLQPLATIAAASLAAARRYENERNDSLVSVTRLTQLYDLEKTFSSGKNSVRSWNVRP